MHTTAAARHTKSFPLFPNHYFNISGLLVTMLQKNKKILYFCGGPFLWGPMFGRTCWTCLNPPLTVILQLYVNKWQSVAGWQSRVNL